MNLLIEAIVFSGLTAACRRARFPTSRSPLLVKATTDGVVRAPSEFGMTTGSPPSMTAITEFVVPRSMPTVLAMHFLRVDFQVGFGFECAGSIHSPPAGRQNPADLCCRRFGTRPPLDRDRRPRGARRDLPGGPRQGRDAPIPPDQRPGQRRGRAAGAGRGTAPRPRPGG